MKDVFVVGAGMAQFGRYPERPLTDLGVEAVLAALADVQLDPRSIQAAYFGTQWGGSMIGQRVMAQVALL
ncbi:MAG: hypothetical protein AB7K04_16055, partial [Pseudorhodoplanes sp.]